MLTLPNNRKPTDEKFTKQLVTEYNTGFRVVYNNLDRLNEMKFNQRIKDNYTHSVHFHAHFISLVEAFKKRQQADDIEKTNKITEIKNELLKVKTERKRQKLLFDIDRLEDSIRRGPTFGGKHLQRDITRIHEQLCEEMPDEKRIELEDRLAEKKKEFDETRRWMIQFPGEAGMKGNRYFDLSRMGEGIVICKIPCTNIRFEIPYEIRGRKNKDLHLKLQKMAMNCEIAISVQLSEDEIHFGYDETVVYGTSHDTTRLEIKLRKEKDWTPEQKQGVRIQNHKDHDKINQERHDLIATRFMGIDSNPNVIGICIADQLNPQDPTGTFKRIIRKRFIEIDDIEYLSTPEQHKKIELIAKELVMMALHDKCFNFVVESLKIDKKNHGNAVSNWKINNLWFRTKLFAGIEKWCNIYGIKFFDIDPAYSSFIGNILYEEYDPVAASIEICRRGMIRFIAEADFYPTINLNELHLSSVGISDSDMKMVHEMYEERRSIGSSIRTWKELYRLLNVPGVSIRRNNKEAFMHRCRSRTIFLRNTKISFKVFDFVRYL